MIIALCVVAVAAGLSAGGLAFLSSRGLLIAGRITLVVVAVVSVPSFVTAVDTILHAS